MKKINKLILFLVVLCSCNENISFIDDINKKYKITEVDGATPERQKGVLLDDSLPYVVVPIGNHVITIIKIDEHKEFKINVRVEKNILYRIIDNGGSIVLVANEENK